MSHKKTPVFSNGGPSGTRRPNRIVLEMSLKPFKRMGEENIEAVCREVLRQWHPLLKIAGECSILFWVADGSEILVWRGDLEEEMEWARYIGYCNGQYNLYHRQGDMEDRAARLYMDTPPSITYGDLQLILRCFKRVAADEYGLALTAGATFDPGPEFAHSPFKYEAHTEIVGGGPRSKIGPSFAMVKAWSTLKGDSEHYAGYPDGIPDGTSFGSFLGRQSRSFMKVLGFDYLWLSNGFGFSHFAWSYLGDNFDGETFGRADYRNLSDEVLSYWRDFKNECPDFPVEVRGTNFAMGMDLASDLCPYREIYSGGFIRTPPPNSPWGSLNHDYGMELAGYMSRIAVLPGVVGSASTGTAGFPFRYYPNDPWFTQNPWWDRYDREPFDIYCPMSVARIGPGGDVENPGIIEFLTIDTERGRVDERCPLEVIPHIRKAVEDYPDQAGPVTWLYPFSEYHALVEDASGKADGVFFGDWFVRSAINSGLPLNTVLPTDYLQGLSETRPDVLRGTVLLTPTTIPEQTYEEHLVSLLRGGGKVFFYGPADRCPAVVRDLLNLRLADPLTGDFALVNELPGSDEYEESEQNKTLRHDPIVSAGGIREVLEHEGDAHTKVWARVRQADSERVYALSRRLDSWNGGIVAWIRGSNPFSTQRESEAPSRVPTPLPDDCVDASVLVRYMLSVFGYTLTQKRMNDGILPIMTFIARHRNAFFLSGYKQNTTVVWKGRFPHGAPILVGKEALLKHGSAVYSLERSFHVECRIFVRQKSAGIVSCSEEPRFPNGTEPKLHGAERILLISGLEDANLVLYPPPERLDKGYALVNGETVPLEREGDRPYARLDEVTGDIWVAL